MFNGVREFFAMLDVNLFWPILIVVLSLVSCLVPYKPIGKIKETEDECGKKEYIIFLHRDK